MSKASTLKANRKGPLLIAVAIALLGPLIALGVYGYGWWSKRSQGKGHWVAVNKGRAFLAEGRPDLAFAAVEHIRDEEDGAGEAMTVAGLALLQLNQPKYARMTLERAIKLQPKQIDAAKALAELYVNFGLGLRGAEMLKWTTTLDPSDLQSWRMLGRVAHDLGESAQASDAFMHAYQLDPKDKETGLLLVAEMVESNQAEQATPYVVSLLKNFPDDPKVLGQAAQHARNIGHAAEAMNLAERALERDPDNLNALLVRARLEIGAGHDEKALADLERAVKLNPNDQGYLQLLGQVESKLGLAERAQKTMERRKLASERSILLDKLTQEIAGKPDDPLPRYEMGKVFAEAGMTLLATRCFQAALALDPAYRPAEQALAALQNTPGAAPTPSTDFVLPPNTLNQPPSTVP